MIDEIPSYKHNYTDEIVCPHCLHEHSDSWEIEEDDDGEMECENCDETFYFQVQTTRTYSTDKEDIL